MANVIYQFESGDDDHSLRPKTAIGAQRLLEQGNAAFVALLSQAEQEPHSMSIMARTLSQTGERYRAPRHEPFASVLTCSDARVPTELLFARAVNDLFVLRVAGNVLGSGVIGSFDYAANHLPSIQLAVVLGHSHCGAITSAVTSFLDPARYLTLSAQHQLRDIMHQLFPAVRLAHGMLTDTHGTDIVGHPNFSTALIEVSVSANAALKAASVRAELATHRDRGIATVFGVYDLESHRVGIPAAPGSRGPRWGLFPPPDDAIGFFALANDVATGPVVTDLLGS